MLRKLIVVLAAAGASLPASLAAQTIKVGLINSYTGFVAQPADQGQKGFDLYIKEHAKDLPPVTDADLGHYHAQGAEFWIVLGGHIQYKIEGIETFVPHGGADVATGHVETVISS